MLLAGSRWLLATYGVAALVGLMLGVAVKAETPIEVQSRVAAGGVSVRTSTDRVELAWRMAEHEFGRLELDLRPGRPLIDRMGIGPAGDGAFTSVVEAVEPVTFLTVGTRVAPPGRPPEMSIWNTFFDNPHKRPYQSYKSKLDRKSVLIDTPDGPGSVTVSVSELTIGPYRGPLEITVYADCRLIHVSPRVSTVEGGLAFVYDAGLAGESLGSARFAWIDIEGNLQRATAAADAAADRDRRDQPIMVRHRALVLEGENGSLACFPAPHQFFFPRDYTDNLRTVWHGRGHLGLLAEPGFGIRQPETGGGNFVPWFNGTPGVAHALNVFYLLSPGKAERALEETLRFTHGDRFPELPGHLTFSSHWHMAIAVARIKAQAEGKLATRPTPEFVKMFKDMNINLIHLGEFHGDGHPQDPGPLRLPELRAMFDECRAHSDKSILFMPGEEANQHLGLNIPGRHPGHWMCFFPRPVYWTMRRAQDQPFEEDHPQYGTVYHVGDRHDMLRLLREQHGLAWTAHARIKASSWTPDIFRHEDFYLADQWLGAAWKAMPADLDRLRLGARGLDLLDDMANWGQKKYVLGEVDVFKLDHTHELYGHMNINYVRLDRVPSFEDGWGTVLDALSHGRFFVTTGEILIRNFSIGGKTSGETLRLAIAGEPPKLRAEIDWTFPLKAAFLVHGDGVSVAMEPVKLAKTAAFGKQTIVSSLPRGSRPRWARFEVWDVASNGAFTQPVWIEPEAGGNR